MYECDRLSGFCPCANLFVPLAVVGLILIFYKQVYVSRQLGVASTAVEVINGRWLMHIFGLREDQITLQLHRVLPNNSLLGLWLLFFFQVTFATRFVVVPMAIR